MDLRLSASVAVSEVVVQEQPQVPQVVSLLAAGVVAFVRNPVVADSADDPVHRLHRLLVPLLTDEVADSAEGPLDILRVITPAAADDLDLSGADLLADAQDGQPGLGHLVVGFVIMLLRGLLRESDR